MDVINVELIKLALKLVTDPSATAKMKEVARKAIADLDVHQAAERAVVSGSGAIAQGEKAVAAGGKGVVAVGGDVSGQIIVTGDHSAVKDVVQTAGGAYISGDVVVGGDVVGRDQIKGDKIVVGQEVAGRDLVIHNVAIPYDKAFDTIAHSTASVLHQLEKIYAQTREQAQGWFRFSLIAAGAGFALIGIGVVAVVLGQLTAGLITSLSSAIPNVVAALFFLQSKAANERVDAIQTKLTEAREVQTAVEIANTISNRKSRDRLKAEIVRKTLLLKEKE